MRKGFLVILAAVLVAVLAAPAMADVNMNGFIRIKPYLSNTKGDGVNYIVPTAGTDNSGNSLKTSNAYTDQRARIKFTAGDENVKFIAHFELDFDWGSSAYQTGRNTGGAIGADSTQIETKNVYVWFKVPNTSIDLSVGMQGFIDAYQGAIFTGANDFAGVVGNYKYDPVSGRFGFAKLYEGAKDKADDVDFYFVEANFSPVKDAKVGVNLYYITAGGLDINSSSIIGSAGALAATWRPAEFNLVGGKTRLKLWTPGVNAAFKVGPADLTGFFFYQFGELTGTKTTFDKINISGYVADLRADISGVLPGKLFIEGLYASGDDNKTDDKFEAALTAGNFSSGMAGIVRTDMYLLLQNGDDITTNTALGYDSGNGGNGMLHFAAGYTQKLTDKLTGKIGVGYLAAAKKRVTDAQNKVGTVTAANSFLNFDQDTAMGTEVNVFLNYNIAKGLDFGVVGAYAWLGNAYKPTAANVSAAKANLTPVVSDPDNLFDLHGRLNYAF